MESSSPGGSRIASPGAVATVGSFLPGYAWQAWGWPGVAGSCLAALAVGLAADWLLCAPTP